MGQDFRSLKSIPNFQASRFHVVNKTFRQYVVDQETIIA